MPSGPGEEWSSLVLIASYSSWEDIGDSREEMEEGGSCGMYEKRGEEDGIGGGFDHREEKWVWA